MGWRDLARSIQDGERESGAGDNRDNGDDSPDPRPIAPAAIRPIDPKRTLRDWHGHLVALDNSRPPEGYPAPLWRRAVEDACWVYENFAGQAVRDGWSALDLFGVLPFDVTLGGLVPRLAGARNLKMDRDRAVWSNWGVRDWTCRGAGDGLIASGIVVLWG